MNPLDILGLLGDSAGIAIGDVMSGLLDAIMLGIWEGALGILRTAFKIADNFSMFTVSTTEGPVSVLWPMMLWIGGVLALGLFFWQIIVTVLRGGRGFTRMVAGPFQYGVALAVTVGLVSSFLLATDALTAAILDSALQAKNFEEALTMTGFTDAISDSVKAVVLGIAGLFGVVPAALGYVVEMLFREAAIYVLVATTPLTAAGLLANVTAGWFWKTTRWLLAAIAMKPVLALALVLGIAIAGGAEGLSGLLAGIGVLLVSLCVPLVLFKLFAFVDPNTDAGAAFRDKLHDVGLDSYGSNSIAGQAGKAATGGGGSGLGASEGSDSGAGQEQANTDRFDRAAAFEDWGEDGGGLEAAGVGDDPAGTAATHGSDCKTGSGRGGSAEGNGDTTADASSATGGADPGAPDVADDHPPNPAHGDGDGGGGDRDGGDDDPPTPNGPGPGGGSPLPPTGGGPSARGGGDALEDKEIEQAAVSA
ncbi:hypothetical protein ABZ863_11160 [Saccharomonospora sp. NPDC046836]|uniref:hypothetical protein n=1 Tax=Saccharomonospora sp. NPDC046836 TaxID=3156921 RepID=UPI0033F3431B